MFLILLLEPVGTTEALTCRQEAQAHLLVNVRDRRISLCANGQEVKSFSVRLAKNGTGKTRASKRYGIFIPIGYPTREQGDPQNTFVNERRIRAKNPSRFNCSPESPIVARASP